MRAPLPVSQAPVSRFAPGGPQMAAAPAKLPESPKQLAAQMSVAVQSALKGQCRLLEVRLPDGLCFGLFGKPPGKQMLGDPDDALIPAVQEQADRELAWLFVEMFQSYGDACCIVFPDSKAAKAAERDWSSTPLTPRVVGSLFELQGRRKAAAGFGGSRPKGSAGGAAPQVIVLVRPKASDVKAVERPEGGVVVLLNAGKWHQKRGYEAGNGASPTWRSQAVARGGCTQKRGNEAGGWAAAARVRARMPEPKSREGARTAEPTRLRLAPQYTRSRTTRTQAGAAGSCSARTRRAGRSAWRERSAPRASTARRTDAPPSRRSTAASRRSSPTRGSSRRWAASSPLPARPPRSSGAWRSVTSRARPRSVVERVCGGGAVCGGGWHVAAVRAAIYIEGTSRPNSSSTSDSELSHLTQSNLTLVT